MRSPGESVQPAPRAPRLDVRDFETTIRSPFDAARSWSLSFGRAHRRAWALLPDVVIDRGADEEWPDPDRDRRKLRRALSVAFPLGEVHGTRRLLSGEEDDLGAVHLRLHVEADPDWTEIEVSRSAGRHGVLGWAPALTDAFHAILDALVRAAPLPALEMLRSSAPELSAAALVREGWARRSGAQVGLRALDDYWDPGLELDLPKLEKDLAAHTAEGCGLLARFGVVRWDDGTLRLVHPLFMELARVTLPWRDEPLWHAARYWLAVDLDAKGCIEDASIRTDRDGTWDVEGDDDGDGSLFHDRLSEGAYGPLSDVAEDYRRPSDAEA